MKSPNEMESRRISVYRDMWPSLREVASDFSAKERSAAKYGALMKYDIGATLRDVVEREDVYGSDAVRQLSVYLGHSESDLYACLNVARKFTREQVEHAVVRPMSDGRHLSFHHLIHLAAIASLTGRLRYLDLTREAAWTTRELVKELDGAGLSKTKRSEGGRKPARPKTAMGAVQDITERLKRLNQLRENWTEVFDIVDEMASDKFQPMHVAKLGQALGEVIKAREQLPRIRAMLSALLERVQQLLAARQASEVTSEGGALATQ